MMIQHEQKEMVSLLFHLSNHLVGWNQVDLAPHVAVNRPPIAVHV